MIVTVTEDRLWLKLEYANENERRQTISSFTKKVKDWQFKKKKFSNWKGDVEFVVGIKKDRMYPGLWYELIKFGKKFGYDIKFKNKHLLINDTISKEWVEKFCEKLFDGHPTHTPRPDQVHAVYMGLKHYFHTEHLSTSAGKTIIIYCITMALLHLKLCKRILIITPDPDLAIQNHSEFLEYENGKFGMKIALLYGGTKTKEAEKYKVAIGNFQYLANKDKSFFETYDAVLSDECVYEETILNTPNGDVHIKDIKIGDYVKSKDVLDNIIFDKVVDKWYTGEREVYEIYLENGYFIICTDNHKIYTNLGWLYLYDIIQINKLNPIYLYTHDEQTYGANDSWELIGRYEYSLREQNQQIPKIKNIPFFQAKQLCLEEIWNTERICQNSTKNNEKWRVRFSINKISNKVFTNIRKILQSLHGRRCKNCDNGVVEYAYGRRFGLLVYGRWFIKKFFTNKYIHLFIFDRGERIDCEIPKRQMECIIGDKLSQRQISLHKNKVRRQEHVLQTDTTIYDQIIDVQDIHNRAPENMYDLWGGIQDEHKNHINLFRKMLEGEKISEERRMGKKEIISSKIKSIKKIGIRKVYDIETEKTHNFFGNGILVHNCQRAKSKSIKEVVDNCGSLVYRGGYSGSIKPDNYADFFTIVAYFGPTVDKITKKQLMDRGDAAQINIEIFILSYADEELRRELYRAKLRLDGDKVLQLEQRFVRESTVRLEWICQLINKLDGNTLVFFTDVKTGYGKDIANKIKDITTHKDVYYLDGSIKNKNRRKEMMDRMEDGMNKVLVANWGVFGVGKSVKNIRYIVVAENRKDDGVINQGTGRGMRIDHDTGKDKFTWIDVVDDFSLMVTDVNGNDDVFYNYMMKWKNDRIRYYKSEGFDYTKTEVDLTGVGSGLEW